MARGDITREAVLDAMREYDALGREEFYKRHRYTDARGYVIEHEGTQYPSKGMYGVAYDSLHPDGPPLRKTSFSGGLQRVVPELRELDFVVRSVNESDDRLRSGIEQVLTEYADARASESYGSAAPMWQTFKDLGQTFNEAGPVADRSTVLATWSVGAGNWARVPWVSFLDSRESDTTQRGVYPVLLFRQDMTGAYITLAQGVTEPKKLGHTEAVAYLQGVAQRVRQQSPELADAGFALDNTIDLRSTGSLARGYERSAIAHKLYEAGSVPSAEEIEDDLEVLLEAYDRYIESKGAAPDDLIRLAAEFRAQRPYPNESDKSHIEARDELRAALSRENLAAVEADPSRYDLLQIGRFAGGAYGGPGPQSSVHKGIIEGGDPAKTRLARALRHLLYDTEPDEAGRIDDLLANDDWQVFGLRESLAVKALAVVYPERWLPFFMYGGDMGKKRIMQAPAFGIEPLDETEFNTSGRRAVESNRRLRNLLEPLFPEDPWAQMQFGYWVRDREAAERPAQLGLEGLADELLLNRQWLEDTVELLRDKRQIIFYGPPGTGKTYVARKLAEYIAQDASRVEIVQFHPSYAYEDFIEGYRPIANQGTGSISFDLRPGPMKGLADQARESEADWCLLIDEINRGNIAKVFGELYYLLEYRDDEIRLQYGDLFRLPKNVFIVGTMNTADRSIALLDAALRRRFHFVPFFPDQQPVEGLLRRWLARTKPGMEYVADLVDKANDMLPDRHLQIGPSHFMTLRLNDDWLKKIWRGSVLPYIEEQFFDEPERVDAFRLERLVEDEALDFDELDEDDGDRASADPASGVEADRA
jgi:MoxR-like ATPase